MKQLFKTFFTLFISLHISIQASATNFESLYSAGFELKNRQITEADFIRQLDATKAPLMQSEKDFLLELKSFSSPRLQLAIDAKIKAELTEKLDLNSTPEKEFEKNFMPSIEKEKKESAFTDSTNSALILGSVILILAAGYALKDKQVSVKLFQF